MEFDARERNGVTIFDVQDDGRLIGSDSWELKNSTNRLLIIILKLFY